MSCRQGEALARHDGHLSDVVTGQSGPVACLTLGESEIAAAASCCKSAVNLTQLDTNVNLKAHTQQFNCSALGPVSYTHLTLPTIYSV